MNYANRLASIFKQLYKMVLINKKSYASEDLPAKTGLILDRYLYDALKAFIMLIPSPACSPQPV